MKQVSVPAPLPMPADLSSCRPPVHQQSPACHRVPCSVFPDTTNAPANPFGFQKRNRSPEHAPKGTPPFLSKRTPKQWAQGLTALFVGLTMIFASLVLAKVPLRLYLSLLTIPLAFGLSGAVILLFFTGGGETLVTLYKGAKISIIGFENGYAKLKNTTLITEGKYQDFRKSFARCNKLLYKRIWCEKSGT